MTRLSKEQVLKEIETNTLSLDHRALSDVSCLSEFENIEKLDLAFNNLTSLEGLRGCSNLKWLSVKQNKLQNFEGIEGLTMLVVLDAGKNKLTSIDEVRHLARLRTLILNDNQIISIGKLDRMKNLETLVLSRNPISEIGNSLVNVRSIKKISLSNCQIQNIGASLKSCNELKEIRLAHNDIKCLPAELAYNTKLKVLDLGNNLISRVSELKMLESLVRLRNLNLKGNPVAENDNLVKKVKRLLPRLQIFNARPIDKAANNEEQKTVNISPFDAREHDKVEASMKEKKDKKQGSRPDNANDFDKETMKKRKKINDDLLTEEAPGQNEENAKVEKKHKERKSEEEPKQKGKKANDIDDRETPFAEMFTSTVAEDAAAAVAAQDTQSVGGLVMYPEKKKKNKKQDQHKALDLAPIAETGLGGPSAWGDD